MVELIEKALSLYDGILRRDREQYRRHPERMIENAMVMNWAEPDLHLLIALHDVFELIEGFSSHDAQIMFGITPEQGAILDLLTRLGDETSEEHFNRVLTSGNITALKIKYLDCIDNNTFEPEDITWYPKVLNKMWSEESKKYGKRTDLIVQKLIELGL